MIALFRQSCMFSIDIIFPHFVTKREGKTTWKWYARFSYNVTGWGVENNTIDFKPVIGLCWRYNTSSMLTTFIKVPRETVIYSLSTFMKVPRQTVIYSLTTFIERIAARDLVSWLVFWVQSTVRGYIRADPRQTVIYFLTTFIKVPRQTVIYFLT